MTGQFISAHCLLFAVFRELLPEKRGKEKYLRKEPAGLKEELEERRSLKATTSVSQINSDKTGRGEKKKTLLDKDP